MRRLHSPALSAIVCLLLFACTHQPPAPAHVFEMPTLPALDERVPPPIEAFGGIVIETVDITVEATGNCSTAIEHSFPGLENYLRASGIAIVNGGATSDVDLVVQLQCSAYPSAYRRDIGLPNAPGLPTPISDESIDCYTSWILQGRLTVTAADHPALIYPLCAYQAPPERIEDCGDAQSPERAAGIGYASSRVDMQILQHLGQIWGSRIYTNHLLDRLAHASTGLGRTSEYWYDDAAYHMLSYLGPDAIDAVPILIQILGDENLPIAGERSAAWSTLHTLTSQSFGFGTYDAEEWQQWWDTNPTYTGQPTPTPFAPDGECSW
jgi:hypothetical protein